MGLRSFMNDNGVSVIFYILHSTRYSERQILDVEKGNVDMFL